MCGSACHTLNTKISRECLLSSHKKKLEALKLSRDREICLVLDIKVLEVVESKGNHCSPTES